MHFVKTSAAFCDLEEIKRSPAAQLYFFDMPSDLIVQAQAQEPLSKKTPCCKKSALMLQETERSP